MGGEGTPRMDDGVLGAPTCAEVNCPFAPVAWLPIIQRPTNLLQPITKRLEDPPYRSKEGGRDNSVTDAPIYSGKRL